MKTCIKCNEEKSLDDFPTKKGRPRGRCRDCTNEAIRQRKKEMKDVIRTCHWCQKEIRPIDKPKYLQRIAEAPRLMYHSPCMSKYEKTMTEIATLLDR